MKKIYFLILSTIIIGFVIGVIFELDRKNSTPSELIDKLPKLMENILAPTTTTTQNNKNNITNVSKFIVQKQNIISEIEHYLKNLKNLKDDKKKQELCRKIFNIRKILIQNEKKLMSIADEKFLKNSKKELRKIINKIRRYKCFGLDNRVEKKVKKEPEKKK